MNIRNLESDRKKYHHLMVHPDKDYTNTMIEMEIYWKEKGMLQELQKPMKELQLKNDYENYKPKTFKTLKWYNHLGTSFKNVVEQSDELDRKEEQWCENNQDYILQQA